MHTRLHTTFVSLWCLLTVVGCASQPRPAGSPPPRSAPPSDIRRDVDAYIADVRRLIADIATVQDEWDRLPDVRGLQDNPVFQDTFRRLDAFFVEAMKARRMQVYSDKVHAFDATVQRQGDPQRHQFVQGVIGYHARLVLLTVQAGELSKNIDAMEPRFRALEHALMLAVAQHPSGDNYIAMMALLTYEHHRFVHKVQAWMGTAPQTQ